MKRFAAWATGWWERCANRFLKAIFAAEILQSQKLFISNMAHELRTPLSTIKTSSEVALLDPSLPRDARASFEEIIGELERISEIINNLLSLGSLARPERMYFKSLDLLPVIERVAERHKHLARERGIKLRLRLVPGSIAWANETAVEQIMTNLVKNALSYTPEHTQGAVRITVAPQGDMVLFQVEDSGIGMSQEDLAHIFEPFYRADTSRTRLVKKGGSGLGLTIVNELVRAHRGKVQIESRRRKGTAVSIFLPAGGFRRALPDAVASADFSAASTAETSPVVQGGPVMLKSKQGGTAMRGRTYGPCPRPPDADTFLRGW